MDLMKALTSQYMKEAIIVTGCGLKKASACLRT